MILCRLGIHSWTMWSLPFLADLKAREFSNDIAVREYDTKKWCQERSCRSCSIAQKRIVKYDTSN